MRNAISVSLTALLLLMCVAMAKPTGAGDDAPVGIEQLGVIPIGIYLADPAPRPLGSGQARILEDGTVRTGSKHQIWVRRSLEKKPKDNDCWVLTYIVPAAAMNSQTAPGKLLGPNPQRHGKKERKNLTFKNDAAEDSDPMEFGPIDEKEAGNYYVVAAYGLEDKASDKNPPVVILGVWRIVKPPTPGGLGPMVLGVIPVGITILDNGGNPIPDYMPIPVGTTPTAYVTTQYPADEDQEIQILTDIVEIVRSGSTPSAGKWPMLKKHENKTSPIKKGTKKSGSVKFKKIKKPQKASLFVVTAISFDDNHKPSVRVETREIK